MSSVSFQLKVVCWRDSRADWALLLADEEHRLLWSISNEHFAYKAPEPRPAVAAMSLEGAGVARDRWRKGLKGSKLGTAAYEVDVGFIPVTRVSKFREVVQAAPIPGYTSVDWVVGILARLAQEGERVTVLSKEDMTKALSKRASS